MNSKKMFLGIVAVLILTSTSYAVTDFTDNFDGPSLDAGWTVLGSAGDFTTTPGHYHLIHNGVALNGLTRTVGSGSFTSVLELDNISLNDTVVSEWRFLDDSGYIFLIDFTIIADTGLPASLSCGVWTGSTYLPKSSAISLGSATDLNLRVTWANQAGLGGIWLVEYELNDGGYLTLASVPAAQYPSDGSETRTVEFWMAADGTGSIDVDLYSVVENQPPMPDPMTWAIVPYALSSSQISMTADTSTHSNDVEYYFECTAGGGNDSGWQNGTSYINSGLIANNPYSYRVKAREKVGYIENSWSTEESATTDIDLDVNAPTPDPMSFASDPAANGSFTIEMTATVATDDIAGVEYYFQCVTDANHDSGWQVGTYYEVTGLNDNTLYTYKVKARDTSPNLNETAWSDACLVTTVEDITAPTPNPTTWATVPHETGPYSIAMMATTASDGSGVEYYFSNISLPGHDSGWQASPYYKDLSLDPNTTYSYKVRTRDNSSNMNESDWSDTHSVTTGPRGNLKVYLLGGQSNMLGWTDNSPSPVPIPVPLQSPREDVLIYHIMAPGWTALRPGQGLDSSSIGPELLFGHDMAEAQPRETIALIKYAWGGTSIDDHWRPPSAGGTTGMFYTMFVDLVNSALAALPAEYEPEIAGMIWMQGEQDAVYEYSALEYEQNLTYLIEDFRKEFGIADMPFVIGQIWGGPPVFWPYHYIVRPAQWNVGHTVTNTSVFSTEDISIYMGHYTIEGQIILGQRFAEAMLQLEGFVGHTALWEMNETSGIIAPDSFSNDFDANLVGMPQWQPADGVFGGALDFNGVDDYLQVPGYSGITRAHTRSCSAWIKTDQPGTIMSWGNSIDGEKWIFSVDSEIPDDPCVLSVSVQGSGQIMGTTELADGNWHHVVATVEDANDATAYVNEIKLYVDGQPETISTVTSQEINTGSGSDVTIGVIDTTSGNYFSGLMDDVALFYVALTPEEITRLYNHGGQSFTQPCGGLRIPNELKLAGDLDWQCDVGFIDFALLASEWMQLGSGLLYDIDGGGVNMSDLQIMANEWLMGD